MTEKEQIELLKQIETTDDWGRELDLLVMNAIGFHAERLTGGYRLWSRRSRRWQALPSVSRELDDVNWLRGKLFPTHRYSAGRTAGGEFVAMIFTDRPKLVRYCGTGRTEARARLAAIVRGYFEGGAHTPLA